MAEIGNVTVRVDAVITDEQYREAMGAVRAANERMDLLESENAKLREERDMYRDLVGMMDHPDLNAQLSAENEQLRELLRDTLTTISWCTIDCCPSDSKKRELNARACELGIELNDCE